MKTNRSHVAGLNHHVDWTGFHLPQIDPLLDWLLAGLKERYSVALKQLLSAYH